ncbi:MAG: dihydroorotase [Clostridiales bacterium]|nr:dihydroorotase [Clostridiales bacterium]
MNSLLIKNARIIDPVGSIDSTGDILVNDGVIAEMGSGIKQDASQTIDADGLVAAPGFLDMHTHLREPGFTDKEDILSGCEAASAGGITALATMPNTNPVADSPDTISYILDKAKSATAKVLPVAAITKGMQGKELTDFEALVKAGAVAFSEDGKSVSDSALMLEALKMSSWYNVPILAHCEDAFLSQGGIMNEGTVSEMLGVQGIPSAAEDAGTARDLAILLSAGSGAKLHICHVSTGNSTELIRAVKNLGVRVTAETCPHYFSFNDELLAQQDADYRMNPPLRSEQDRKSIIRGLIDGTIDAIATDHAPHTAAEKADFLTAPNGTIGLETSFSAAYTYLVKGGYISLFKLIYLMSAAPAKILCTGGGSIRVGSPANFTLIDLNEKWCPEPGKLHGKSHNSVFKGVQLTSKIKYTVYNGKLVFKD